MWNTINTLCVVLTCTGHIHSCPLNATTTEYTDTRVVYFIELTFFTSHTHGTF